MARQTTKKKVETPEVRADIIAEEIKHEGGIDALRAELERYKLAVKNLSKTNEELSDEISRLKNK